MVTVALLEIETPVVGISAPLKLETPHQQL